MTYLWIAIALLSILILWSCLEHRMIVNSKYIIKSKSLDKDIHGLSFVLLSDLHNSHFGKNNEKLLNKIVEQNPDFVIIAGDMITKRKPCYPGYTYNLIKNLSERYPVYYAYGNHEQYFEDLAYNDDESAYKGNSSLYESWCVYKEKLKLLGVYLLDNKSIMLKYKDSSITITGFSVSADFYESSHISLNEMDEIISKIGNRSKEGYQILIAHNPLYFADYIHWGADLILSGHMHGGLIRIPFLGGLISPQARFFPKYDAGLFVEDQRHMVISKGLGGHSIMPRLFNPPELVQITLMNETD